MRVKIKQLQYEIGRYQKKIADQQREITAMREEILQKEKGVLELSRAIDSVVGQLIIKYGDSERCLHIPCAKISDEHRVVAHRHGDGYVAKLVENTPLSSEN